MDSHGWLLRTCRRSPKKKQCMRLQSKPKRAKKMAALASLSVTVWQRLTKHERVGLQTLNQISPRIRSPPVPKWPFSRFLVFWTAGNKTAVSHAVSWSAWKTKPWWEQLIDLQTAPGEQFWCCEQVHRWSWKMPQDVDFANLKNESILVGGFNQPLWKILVKMEIFPRKGWK